MCPSELVAAARPSVRWDLGEKGCLWCSTSWEGSVREISCHITLNVTGIRLPRVLQKHFNVPLSFRECRILFPSHSHSMAFAEMLEMRGLLDATLVKKHPTAHISSVKFKKEKK